MAVMYSCEQRRMSKVRENLHRWKDWVDSRQLEILKEAAVVLRVAWRWDNRHPKSYPVNTDHALWETKVQLRNQPIERQTGIPAYRRPKSVHDFINEGAVERLYEQQHSESYRDALFRASQGLGAGGFTAWKEIVNCMIPAYLLDFAGEEALPKPRVNFLHRELLEIAETLELDHQEGLAEFLNDICPCEKEHNAEAIRKLRKRISRIRKSGA
jgi:hypothetical protein